ncbi:MAG: hypothetical protein WAX85_00995 [Minisyncoccia bacterium]
MIYRSKKKSSFLIQDIGIITLSVIVAIVIVKADILSDIVDSAHNFRLLGSFIAGLFFTSAFTTAPAIVTFGEMVKTSSIFTVAFAGATGALIGDLIIFRFVSDRLSDHLFELIKHQGMWRRLRVLFKLRYFRWFTFLAGGLILASPLPDELGIGLLGFSKIKVSHFIPISFFFNFVGILIIGFISRAI